MGSEQDTPGSESVFSLELSEDLRDMRSWVHDFAATVIRPAGAEWVRLARSGRAAAAASRPR
jgi:hypothetical protein